MPPRGSVGEAVALDRAVTVATFNVHHGAPPGRRFAPAELWRAVRRLGVDLLALQEVDRRVGRTAFVDQATFVARATGLHPTFVGARRLGITGRYGIALLARTPPTAVEALRLPAFGGEQRVAVLASVELGGRSVSVAATHLHHRDGIAARQLPTVLAALTRRPGPHLLLGDLNADHDEVGHLVEEAGLVAVESPPTFPTRLPTQRIDWIAAGGVQIGAGDVPPIWVSDHFPLVASLT